MTAGAEDDGSAISEALASDEVSAVAAVKLSVALRVATQAVTEGLATLHSISDEFSADVQAQVSAAVEQVGTDAAGSVVLPKLGTCSARSASAVGRGPRRSHGWLR